MQNNTSEMQKPVTESGTHISIPVEEYERLKKLEENIKNKIKNLKLTNDLSEYGEGLLEYLESLYE